MSMKEFFLGKPLKNSELANEKLNRLWGLPIMSSDAVSSVAFAIEEILLVLVPMIGMAAIHYLNFVAIPIIVLLVVLVFSYSQIIDHYPHGGGSYNVSSENLGKTASLVAAAALIIDYVMTVAVGLSSATAAITAAFPPLAPYRVGIAIFFLALMTLINMRGTSESSKIFGVPTYAFIVMMGILIITGLVELVTGHLQPIAYAATPQANMEMAGFSFVFLLLKAFSSGCSALTGVEAVSNAVPMFRNPAQKNAKQVLYMLGIIVIFVFGGSVILASKLQVIPLEGETVMSQMGRAVFGNSFLYYILQFVTSMILLLSANTAYNGLPSLMALLSKDGYLPRQFSKRGIRLSLSNGILFITIVAGITIIAFDADTHHLIPLFSVGVFLSFTLSQVGMVAKWIRTKEKGWRHKFLINALGALMTLASVIVVFITKFSHGAWMLAIIIPALAIMMNKIHKHYSLMSEQLRVENFKEHYYPSRSQDTNPCLILVGGINKSMQKALNYANGMSKNVTALHVAIDPEEGRALEAQWRELGIDVPLKVIETSYRSIVSPIEEYLTEQEKNLEHGEDLSLVMVKFVEKYWYDKILHNQTTYYLERMVRRHKNVTTVLVPYIYYQDKKEKKK